MVTHREIKKLEDIKNIFQEIKNEKGIVLVDELIEIYFEAFIITGMTAQMSWGARDENNEYLDNAIKFLEPRTFKDYVCWKCSNKENEKNRFKGLMR